MFETIIFEKAGGVARITLNRPQVLNAINRALLTELDQALDEIENDSTVRVVVITGKGRAFCAGADLKSPETASRDGELHERFIRFVHRVINRIEDLGQPVIAAVHGFTLAGGLELMLACDLAIASDTAQLGDQHANYGLIPGGGGSQRLPRLIGIRKAKELLFTGDRISGEEAARLGLVNKVVPADKLDEAVNEMVDKLLTKNAAGIKVVKALVNWGMQADLRTGLELEKATSAYCSLLPGFQEGLKAFREKRQPEFSGS